MDKKSEYRFSPAICITTKTISQMTLSLTHSRGIHPFFSTISISPSPWRYIRQLSMPFQGHIPLQQILVSTTNTPHSRKAPTATKTVTTPQVFDSNKEKDKMKVQLRHLRN
jgi:hypothetical protein